MKKYFNINYEFNQQKVDEIIIEHINSNTPGYVCSMDMNNLQISLLDPKHLEVVNSSIVNNCDSAWTPTLINLIYGTKYSNYCGNDVFIKFIKMKKFKQFFLGATDEILTGLREQLSLIDPEIKEMRFETLPFKKVEDFDYKGIAEMINNDAPDIIWVSLGAPKQEQFMFRLKPLLNRGVMFGFGAIFGFYSGTDEGAKIPPLWIKKLKLQWLFRLFDEPGKQYGRIKKIIITLPKVIINEVKLKKTNSC